MIISMFEVPLTVGAVTTDIKQTSATSGDFGYQILYDETVEITDYYGTNTKVEIPSALRGYTVTSISNYAFSGCENLTSISLPDSVTSIGKGAFDGTAWYESQPNGLVYAGKVAYKYKGTCPETILLKEGTLGIAEDAFAKCKKLANITIPDSVTTIGSGAFSGCESLTSIIIPDGVTTDIEEWTFSNCINLTSVIIGDDVTRIDWRAFSGCQSLESVTVGSGVTYIYLYVDVFDGCKNLKKIEVSPKNKTYSSINGNLYNKEQTEIIRYAIGKTDTSFIIPNTVTSIGNGAFCWVTNLKKITIPDSVTSIGNVAFWRCTSLTSVTIPDSVTNIGWLTFDSCENLTSIIIGRGVANIDSHPFYGCINLTSITIPESVISISDEELGYYYDSDSGEYKKSSLTIKGYKGTEAQRYADDNGFTFIDLDNPSASEPAKTTVTVKNAPKNIYVKGTATITVTNNDVSKSFKINVKNPKLNKSKKSLKKGEKFKLTVTGKVGKQTYTSNNKKVATINKKGKITAKKKGTATITVKTNGMKLKCKITVK